MPNEIDGLRNTISELHRGRGKSYPPELRDEIINTARMLRGGGWSWVAISEAFGLSVKSLRSLMKRWEVREPPAALRAVAVTTAPPQRTPSGPRSAELTLVSPTGWRLEGLGVEQAVALLAKLPC